ncbi:uncharacterized protein LOC117222807 [Megalopta genalis]|uniref:uncharacterized protein LOC117222807 n=1 Tax=Megalopta genalis TaxID=115081 RepID=UPI003FD59E74
MESKKERERDKEKEERKKVGRLTDKNGGGRRRVKSLSGIDEVRKIGDWLKTKTEEERREGKEVDQGEKEEEIFKKCQMLERTSTEEKGIELRKRKEGRGKNEWEVAIKEMIRKEVMAILREEVKVALKEEIRDLMDSLEESKRDFERKRKEIMEEVWKLRGEIKNETEKMAQEKKRMKKQIKEITRREKKLVCVEKTVKKLEVNKDKEGNRIAEEGDLCRRLREMEIKWEKKSRSERKKNIIIKGIKIKEGGNGREEAEQILKEIGSNAVIEEIRKGEREEGGGEWCIVKIKTMQQKRDVMERKKILVGRKERIEDDMTWEERKIKWRIRQIVEQERRKGKKVVEGYMKIWMGGERWVWDEKKEVLRNRKGKELKEEERKENAERME